MLRKKIASVFDVEQLSAVNDYNAVLPDGKVWLTSHDVRDSKWTLPKTQVNNLLWRITIGKMLFTHMSILFFSVPDVTSFIIVLKWEKYILLINEKNITEFNDVSIIFFLCKF